MKLVPFAANLSLWRQPVLTLLRFFISVILLMLGASLLAALLKYKLIRPETAGVGFGAILGIMSGIGFSTICKILRQNKAVREKYFTQNT